MRVATIFLLLGLAACSRTVEDDARRFQLTGTVTGRDPSARVVVAHDAVGGLMPAMSMAFEVTGTAPAVREGDRIIATLAVTSRRSWLEDVRVTSAGGDAGGSRPAAGRAAALGAMVPAFPFVDQDGRPMTLHDFAGRVVIVTFIYTRCPLPDFCPLMVAHLEDVRRRANAAQMGGRVALLGVTLDPAFDTPAVLRAYGEAVLKGAARFDQWTLATGSAPQIDDLARFFGVGYRGEHGFITHSLTTAVIGHDGRLMRVFPSNAWRPDELFAVVSRGVERAAAESTH